VRACDLSGQSGLMKSHFTQLRPVLDRVVSWAESVPDVRAIGLTGSWARNEARADSDVDLIVLAQSHRTLLEDTGWVSCVGTPTRVEVEDWNAIQSVRVNYDDGREIEFGLGAVTWAETDPVDPGTRRVLEDGFVVIYDPDLLMANLLRSGAC
jgi:hypothetical protein